MTIILAIETSCDETSVAVVDNQTILSNIIWSQASQHAEFGGVFPSLAQRLHREHIDWVIKKALGTSKKELEDINAVAVTVGPGLAIALEVGISKAKELCKKYNKSLIPVNHIEAHILSPLAVAKNQEPKSNYNQLFPALGIVTSGGHTEIILMKSIGSYEILATTLDDALGESLDKAARLLGLGYPGGAVLEKLARSGNPKNITLPIPMLGRENDLRFSYSGLKTAFFKKLSEFPRLTPQETADLASSYQNTAFLHFIRIFEKTLQSEKCSNVKHVFAGGGVMANILLRKMIRNTCNKHNISISFPYSRKLYGDNAGMIGVVAYFKYLKSEFLKPNEFDSVERIPRAKVDQKF